MDLNNVYLITRKGRITYDENAAMVIIAKNARKCRKLAAEDHADEPATEWLSPKLSAVRKIGVSPISERVILAENVGA